MNLEFPFTKVYSRRAEIIRSIDVFFLAGRWLNICYGQPTDGHQAGFVRDEVREWCAANMRSPYTFSKMSVRAVTTDHLHLHVTDEVDGLNFMMRWF